MYPSLKSTVIVFSSVLFFGLVELIVILFSIQRMLQDTVLFENISIKGTVVFVTVSLILLAAICSLFAKGMGKN